MSTKWGSDSLVQVPALDARQLAGQLECACAITLQPGFRLMPEHGHRDMGRRRFSPSLSYGRHFSPPLPTARAAAVMVMIEPHDGHWAIPLTVRPIHLPDHPGQVCLPGGRVELNETIEGAAEREFCEELGLSCFPTRTLGRLQSIYVYNSDFLLTPCVAISEQPLEYHPCADEVESLVYLPLSHLLSEDHHQVRHHSRGLATWQALGIQTGDTHIWGATAIALGELAAILERSGITG